MVEELRYIQIEHAYMPSRSQKYINATANQIEKVHNNHLASHLAGARVLAKYNNCQRTARERYRKITQYFKPIRKHNMQDKDNRSKFRSRRTMTR
jgi:hypothetical protein